MGSFIETIFTTDSNGAQFTCSAWDPRTGTNLMTYKGGGAANSRSLCLVGTQFIVTANSTKPMVHIWPINSQEQVPGVRIVLPGKPNALAISPDGNYLVVGIQETIYIWEICSGKMLNTISKHYQSVCVIKFTDDGSHVITAGMDGNVFVYNLTKVFGQTDNDLPVYTFNDHALPVTDVYVGSGGMRAFFASVSMDRTCRFYDLSSGKLLLNLVFNEALTSVTFNLLETAAYVGTSSGSIFEFNISSPPRTKEYHLTKEDYTNKFIGHKERVTCLTLSLDGETLASGGDDGNVNLWHIPSRQMLRTLAHKSTVTNISFLLSPIDTFHADKKYNLVIGNLKRMMDATTDDSHVIEINVRDAIDEANHSNGFDISSVKSVGLSNNQNDCSQEIDRLREEVQNLKKLNQEIFQYSFKNIFNPSK